jgi:hypothetical protein
MNSISDSSNYRSACRLAYENEDEFKNFKSDPHYNGILEHVSSEQGDLYLDYININFPEFMSKIERFKLNDIYGGPKLYNYQEIGEISPSTLRYIKVLSDLKSIFGNLDGKKIIEIGGGYGGQCFILNQIFGFKEYSIVDLDEPLLLTDKYLKRLEVNHRSISIDEVHNIEEDFDLVISNYAYSEVSRDLQNLYWEKIIKKSKNGYLTLNFISHLFGIDSYSENDLLLKISEKNPALLKETPQTFEKNVILYF